MENYYLPNPSQGFSGPATSVDVMEIRWIAAAGIAPGEVC
jgi:hypothetical protein